MQQILEKRLKDQLSPAEIAITLFEITGRCFLCNNSGKVENKECPCCYGDPIYFWKNRIKRYKKILQIIPSIFTDIWEDINYLLNQKNLDQKGLAFKQKNLKFLIRK